MADETRRKQRNLSKVLTLSQDDIRLTPPCPSMSSNNVSREDVRQMVNEQKNMMDSNMKVQIKARKCFIIAAAILLVFILGLMIGIVVYKDRRIRGLESKNRQAIKELASITNKSISEIKGRLNQLEGTIENRESLRKELRDMNETINVTMNELRRDLVIQIKEDLQLDKEETTTNKND